MTALLERQRHTRRLMGRGRAAHRFPCTVVMGGPQQQSGKALRGQAVHISAEQLVLLLPESPTAGARVHASIALSDGRTALVAGQVARCRRVLTGTYEVGVRLVSS